MSRHDPALRLRHMLEYARTAKRLAQGRTRADLDADEMLRLALIRTVEVIGEAAAGIPESERERYPAIPWKPIIASRNRLIHGYAMINLDILWDILDLDLPSLIAELENLLKDQPIKEQP